MENLIHSVGIDEISIRGAGDRHKGIYYTELLKERGNYIVRKNKGTVTIFYDSELTEEDKEKLEQFI